MSPATFRDDHDQHFFEAIFTNAPVGIVLVDIPGNIISINPLAVKQFGYAENELAGEKIDKLIPDRFREKHAGYHQQYFNQPVSRPMGAGRELSILKKDGTETPVEISLNYFNTESEKYVMAFIVDISSRKKAETDLKNLNAELEATVMQRSTDLRKTMHELDISNDTLEEALSFQKALLDNAGAMIIATDENGIIKLFNPEAAACIGYDESDVVNKHTPVLFHDKTEIAKKRKRLLDLSGVTLQDDFAVLVEKSKRNIHIEEHYTYIRKNGTSFPVSLTVTAIRNHDGEITGFMGIAIDITDRKKVEEDLLISLKKEKELSELKTRFVSMASHEFRTPLSTVLSSAYLIEKYTTTDDQPKREKHLRRIISSVSLLTDILNDFLSLGKIEEGKIQVRLTEFNIQDLIKTTIGEIRNTLKKQQIIRYDHQGGTTVRMDVALLKHIAMNLISNASKFSSETGAIEIKTICRDHLVILSVKDHGIGISKEDQKHLMERFFRGSNAANIQGTGLGLHIVSKYAELMKGKVECISELEKGTEFLISFHTKTD